MPTLPTLTVTDAQAARITAAFQTTTAYKAWLKEQIINFVINYEISQDDSTYLATREAKRVSVRTDLDSVT